MKFFRNWKLNFKTSQDYLPFAFLVIIAILLLSILISWFLYSNNLKHWKRKSDTVCHGIAQVFQERLQEATLIMSHLGRKIAADGATDFQKIEELIRSTDLNSVRSNPLFTWAFLDWIDTTGLMRVNGAAGIFENPPNMNHREFIKNCRKAPWTLQVCKPDIGIPSGVWLIPVGLGVEGKNHEYLGIVSGGLQIEPLREIFHAETGNDEIDFLLIDDKMNLIVQSTELNFKEKLFHNKNEINFSFFNKIESIFIEPVCCSDIKFYSHRKIKNFPYIILVGCNKKTVQAELIRQLLPHFLEIFLIGLVCLIVIFSLWKKILESILYFSEVVFKISQGELEVAIPPQKSIQMNYFAKHLHQVISYIKNLEQSRNHLERSYHDLNKKHAEASYLLELFKNHDQEKSKFFDHFYQDIQSTLMIILSYSQALLKNLKGDLDIELSEKRQGEFLDHIISITSDLQKSTISGFQPSNVNVQAALENILHIQLKEAFLKKVTLQCSIDPLLSEISLDELKFKQIVMGLLNRAIEYTPMEGKVEIKAQIEVVENQKLLKITIEDNGFGLSEKDIQGLIEKFSKSSSFDPTRLSLPEIENLIKMHQGSISIENNWKQGTSVKILFPYTPSGLLPDLSLKNPSL